MTSRLCAVFMLFFVFLLASCSPAPTLDPQDWPDDDDIATWIALTLTQRFKDGQQVTPQPEGQDPVNIAAEGESGEGVSGDDELLNGTRTQDVLTSSAETGLGEGQATEENALPTGETPTIEATSTMTVEETQYLITGTPTVRVTEIPTPTEEEIPEIVAGIPGFNALDLVERLAGYGFECPGQVNPPEDPYQLLCIFDSDEFQFVVNMWGRGANSIDLVEAAAFYFGDYDYTSFVSVLFEAVAEISYDGSVPSEAKDWVASKLSIIDQIGDEIVDEFGGVRYYMYALLSAQVLEIGRLHTE